jgi:hypothetical protein
VCTYYCDGTAFGVTCEETDWSGLAGVSCVKGNCAP